MVSSPSSSTISLPSSSTLLALPDGLIPSGSDRSSYTISLIGGYPTFPTFPKSSSSVSSEEISNQFICGSCSSPIPLLAQVYCPPENGENDRIVYVFACPKRRCQRKEGSISAWRASRKNEEYVKDVEEKRRKKEEEERKIAEEKRKNPFTMSETQTNGPSLFASSNGLFGASNPFASSPNPPASHPVPDLSTLNINGEKNAEAGPSSLTLFPPYPAYQPPQYLSTVDEYLPPPDEMDVDDDDENETAEQKAEWRDERWEQVLPDGMDPIFERFVRRINDAEGGESQVLRYELGGVPLPYSSSSPLTSKLFPKLAEACKAQKQEDEDPSPSSFYSTSTISACPRCKGKRVFELQLLPSLISHLSTDNLSTTGDIVKKGKKKQSEEERRKELKALAIGIEVNGAADQADGEVVFGMEWGSICVFGCESDCVGFGEEFIGVEWESQLGESKKSSVVGK